MKKLFKHISKIRHINVFIYVMKNYQKIDLTTIINDIKIENLKNDNKKFYIIKDLQLVHQSFLYNKVFLMRQFGEKGPVIGDCYTKPTHRGKSIYPSVINYIAKKHFETRNNPIFVIVGQNNKPSIKGIEKAGFIKYASLKAKRWMWIYLSKQIIMN